MYIGVDIGGSKIRVASSDLRLHLRSSRKVATPENPAAAVADIVRLIGEVSIGQSIQAVAVAAPGALDYRTGTLITAPNMPWRNVPIVKLLKKELGVPVILENDHDAAGLAEATMGAGKGQRFVLYVTISTGIGAALVIDGVIYHGAHDTEGGHITLEPGGPECGCGGRGHFESLVSGKAIKRRFNRYGYEIKDAPTWNKIAHDMAWGLANLSAMTSPDVIVLGGGVSVHWDRFHKPLLKHFAALSSPLYPPPKIVLAKYVETAALYGCFLMAQKVART